MCNSPASVNNVLVEKSVEMCCQCCNLFGSSAIQTMAGAQQQFKKLQKFKELVYCPSKCSLSKIMTQEAFAKNGESGLAMWKTHLFLQKIKRFLRQPGLLHFLVEIPRVLKMLCSSIKQISPIEGCQTPTLSCRSPIKPIKTDLGGSQARQV